MIDPSLGDILYAAGGGLTGASVSIAIMWTRLHYVEQHISAIQKMLTLRTDHGPTIEAMSGRLTSIEAILLQIQLSIINKAS